MPRKSSNKKSNKDYNKKSNKKSKSNKNYNSINKLYKSCKKSCKKSCRRKSPKNSPKDFCKTSCRISCKNSIKKNYKNCKGKRTNTQEDDWFLCKDGFICNMTGVIFKKGTTDSYYAFKCGNKEYVSQSNKPKKLYKKYISKDWD